MPPVTHIFDNFSKDAKSEIKPLLELAQTSPNFKLYSFISSAHMYSEKRGELDETDSVYLDNEPRQVEMRLAQALPGKWAAFRPLYMYGPYRHKRKRSELDWFLGRALLEKPLGVPHGGSQRVSVTHSEDVAELVSSVVGKEDAAGGEIFNCGTSDTVTYMALCVAA